MIAEPYLGRAHQCRPRSCGCWNAAATWGWRPTSPRWGRLGLVAQTVETVRFTRPERVDFRLVRGLVPHVVEAFVLSGQAGGRGWPTTGDRGRPVAGGTVLVCAGCAPLGADGAASLAAIKAEAQRRATSAAGARGPAPTNRPQRRRSSSLAWPSGPPEQPFIGRPVRSNGRVPGSARPPRRRRWRPRTIRSSGKGHCLFWCCAGG